MRNTVAVGNDQRRAIVGVCLEEGLEGLGIVGAHGNLGNIDVAIGHGNQAEVFLGQALAVGGEFGNSRTRGRLGSLTARVGVNFGIEDQDIDIASGGHDVIEAAVTNVIRPAVAADDPNALTDQGIGQFRQEAGTGVLAARQLAAQGFHAGALGTDAGIGGLIGIE